MNQIIAQFRGSIAILIVAALGCMAPRGAIAAAGDATAHPPTTTATLNRADFDAGMKALKLLDYAGAKRLFDKAAAGGNSEAMYWMGRLYLDGKGFPTDYPTAMKWMQKGAVAGNAHAMRQ